MNAIDTEGHPIPGLYVIGQDSGGYFANTYPNLIAGMCAGRAATWGGWSVVNWLPPKKSALLYQPLTSPTGCMHRDACSRHSGMSHE